MEKPEAKEQPAEKPAEGKDAPPIAPSPVGRTGTIVSPQVGEQPCPACEGAAGTTTPSYIYAIGRVEPRFPSLGVEKELAQAIGRAKKGGEDVAGADRDTIYKVLSLKDKNTGYWLNGYLARKMCYVLKIQELDTYILQPRSSADFQLLLDAVSPTRSPKDLAVAIGVKGPIAPPEVCNGLMLPIVTFDQMYFFEVDDFIKKIPKPEEVKDFTTSAEELFWRIVQMADNCGAMDEHRALNYLAVQYPNIYHLAAERHGKFYFLTEIEAHLSLLSCVRKIMDVIFSYTNRNTDVTEKYFVRVDVTEEFPFLVTKLSPYYGASSLTAAPKPQAPEPQAPKPQASRAK